jgi:hypothetical protein
MFYCGVWLKIAASFEGHQIEQDFTILSFRKTTSAIACVSFGYALLEWLFLVTKPSFFNYYPWLKSVKIYFSTALLFFIFLFIAHWLLQAMAWIFMRHVLKIKIINSNINIALLIYFLSFVLLVLCMLLADNFTYTLWGWGIIDTQSGSRVFYWLALVAVYLFLLRSLGQWSLLAPSGEIRGIHLGVWLILGFSTLLLFINVISWEKHSNEKETLTAQKYPNIVIIASDGIEANHMSAYGYHRQTTPNLDALESRSLIFENAFSNAAQTTGAVTALLNGKFPARTKVFYPPHFLTGMDSHQHLPGILKKLGYNTVQIAVSWWADSDELNFINGFDIVNERTINEIRGRIPFEFYGNYRFLQSLADRPIERFSHLLGLKRMINPYREVMPTPRRWPLITDVTRFSMLEDAIDAESAPFFLHMHLNDSHGVRCLDQECEYDVSQRQFSLPHEHVTAENRVDYYDDAVLDSDRNFRKLLDFLGARGLLENTIIVVYSDHSAIHTTDVRVPLIFILPRHSEGGGQRISSNAQLLDVAPTLLDYIGVDIPNWMDGQSLLATEPDPMKEIYVIGTVIGEGGKPPRYALRHYALVTCQRHYLLTIKTLQLAVTDVTGHTAPCPVSELKEAGEARQSIVEHLENFGVETGPTEPSSKP